MATTTKQQLSHPQFYALTECVKTNRDGIGLQNGWDEARKFIDGKLTEQKAGFSTVLGSLKAACEIAGVHPRPLRKVGKGARNYQHELAILTRALGKLYDSLGTEKTEGLKRLLEVINAPAGTLELRNGQITHQ